VLDEHAYHRLCLQHGWNYATERRLAVMRWYMLALLTGDHLPAPEGAGPAFIAQCTRFRMIAPTQVRAFLRDQAQTNLEHAGIDEPVTWEPPASWVDLERWPGIDPGATDVKSLSTILQTAEGTRAAAAPLGLAGEHVRLLCQVHEIGIAPGTANGRPAPPQRAALLEPRRLRELYVDQNLPPSVIAEMASCSIETVLRLLRHDGIAVRGHPRRFPDRPAITREWLYQRYVVDRCDLHVLAAEHDTNRNHLMKLMKEWDIPRRAGSSMDSLAYAHLDLPAPPSPPIQAVAQGPMGLTRLRLIVQIPGYKNFVQAANNIYDGNAMALLQRVTAIEKYAGFRIIDRKATPMTATPQGQAFIDEAKTLLSFAR
jgi:hypothetical protein